VQQVFTGWLSIGYRTEASRLEAQGSAEVQNESPIIHLFYFVAFFSSVLSLLI